MTQPSFVNVGTGSETQPTWGTHVADDLGLLCHETANESPATPSGWTATAPVASRADTKNSGSYLFATSGAMTDPTLATPSNHAYGIIALYRNVDKTSPFVTTVTSMSAANTTGFAPGFYCPVGGVRVVYVISYALDATSLSVSSPVNSSLTDIQIRTDGGTATGNGGGIAIIDGALASAGAVEALTWTQTSSAISVTIYVLRPNAEVAASGTVTIDGAAAPNGTDVVTLINLTQPADPPITGIDISGGAGGWNANVRYTGDTYQAIYRSASAYGASDDTVVS